MELLQRTPVHRYYLLNFEVALNGLSDKEIPQNSIFDFSTELGILFRLFSEFCSYITFLSSSFEATISAPFVDMSINIQSQKATL